MSTPFVDAVDAELVATQRELTPRIFTLRSQRQTLVVYRRTLALDASAEPTSIQEKTR